MGVRTLEGSTHERREIIVGRLERVVPGALYSLAGLVVVDGALVYDHIVTRGSGDAARGWAGRVGNPSYSPWDPETPLPRAVNRFSSGGLERLDQETRSRMPIHREAYGPYGLLSDRRMLAYDGSRFVGWLGVVRHEQAPDFSPEEERRLQRHARSFVDDIVAVARSEGRGGPENAHALFRPDGSAELACENARAWLDRHRIGALATRVRAVDQSRHAAATFALDGARAHLTRLSGEGPTRYLVVLTGARRPRVSAAARLTPRQREVAKLAATGARVVDVGRLLGISPETVRRHLKAVYARLLVANRVELAHALDDES